jgi:hypothetical protein
VRLEPRRRDADLVAAGYKVPEGVIALVRGGATELNAGDLVLEDQLGAADDADCISAFLSSSTCGFEGEEAIEMILEGKLPPIECRMTVAEWCEYHERMWDAVAAV